MATSGTNGLTAEQLRRMEENRLKAIEKRAQAAAKKAPQAGSTWNYWKYEIPINSKPFTTVQQKPVNQPMQLPPTLKKNIVQGKCVLMSNMRFVVVVGYHQQLIEIFKTIPTRMYDIQTKQWNFEIQVHSQLMKELIPLKSEVAICPLPHFVIKIFQPKNTKKDVPESELNRLDPTLKESLMTFQRDGVLFGIGREGRVLIADDMGLGKTIQALAIANYYRSDWPLLIVAPSSIRYSWLEAIKVWMPSVDPQTIAVLNSSKDELGQCQVYITSYELMTRRKDELKERKCNVAIMDESHLLKNFKSARTKAATDLLKNAKRVILLSGTPALSRPIELHSQINLIHRQLFPSYQEFGLRYCNGKKTNWGWDFSGSTNTEELVLILRKECMIRRIKSDVIKELPAKLRRMILLDPTDIKINKNMEDFADLLSNSRLKGMERRGTLLNYFQITAKAKSKAVCNYVTDLLESEIKFLCFAHHRVMMDNICTTIENTKCQYIRIDGKTSSEARKNLVDRFQHNDNVRVAVLSITAANTGLTLTAAQLVVFSELYWNPGILTQAEDRVHRIGQDNSVLVQYLVAKGTADDYLWLLIQDKLEVLNKAGLSKDNFREADTMKVNSREKRLMDDFLLLEVDEQSVMTESPPPKKSKMN